MRALLLFILLVTVFSITAFAMSPFHGTNSDLPLLAVIGGGVIAGGMASAMRTRTARQKN